MLEQRARLLSRPTVCSNQGFAVPRGFGKTSAGLVSQSFEQTDNVIGKILSGGRGHR